MAPKSFTEILIEGLAPDGGLINIRAWLEEQDERPDEVYVEVADTGVGIDPANHELIFEKFFRVADPGLHSTGTTKFMGAGPGLGLTIARGVIEGHGVVRVVPKSYTATVLGCRGSEPAPAGDEGGWVATERSLREALDATHGSAAATLAARTAILRRNSFYVALGIFATLGMLLWLAQTQPGEPRLPNR